MTPDDQPGVGHGTFLLADISGYTAFLQAVAHAHAADMAAGRFVPEAYPLLTSLLDGIVERVVPPFELSKLEGDAIFAFAAEEDLPLRGRALLGCLGACYASYRARLGAARELMVCDCDACLSIGGLELKFVLHHGSYIRQPVAGTLELLGPEVTMAHLLLKNHVADHLGRSAYALFSEQAAAHLEVPLDDALWVSESYPHHPPVRAAVLRLPAPG